MREDTLLQVAGGIGGMMLGVLILLALFVGAAEPACAQEVEATPSEELERSLVESCLKYGGFTIKYISPDGVQYMDFVCMPIIEKVEEGKRYEF